MHTFDRHLPLGLINRIGVLEPRGIGVLRTVGQLGWWGLRLCMSFAIIPASDLFILIVITGHEFGHFG